MYRKKILATVGLVFLVAVALALRSGCSRGGLSTYRAGGKVTFPDGTPVTGGWVEFRAANPDSPVSARGQIKPDGSFQLTTYYPDDGAIEGEHQALVIPPMPSGDPDERPSAIESVVDPRFQRFETSGLKFTVTTNRARNQFVIVIQRPQR